jgi:mycofactocin glycosyltransferase
MTLPTGFQVRLARGVLRADGDRLLVGGSPLTAMRLKDRNAAVLEPGGVTVNDAASAHLAERLLATNLGIPDLDGVPGVDPAELSVVIPVRDRPTQLDRALAALSPLRCFVVDDASRSPEQVAEVARRHGANLVVLDQNLGPAGARNAGLAAVTTPYVAFVDSDVEVAAAELLRLARHFADPAVSLAGPRVVGVARSERPRWFERYDVVASSLTLGSVPCTVQPGAAVAWLPSACLVARTEVVVIGGFDADLRVGEDVDLVWRLVENGHGVRYDPSVEAFHDARATLHDWLGRKFVYGTGGAGLAARHGDNLAPAILTPTYAVAAAALLMRSRWAVPVAVGALVSGSRSIRRSLPDAPGQRGLAPRLATRGLVWAVRQETALILRHWWPLAAIGALRSRHVRRALVSSLVMDAAVTLTEQANSPGRPGTVSILAARRLDDLAYGAGLWWGAFQARSARVLMPRRPGRRRSNAQ